VDGKDHTDTPALTAVKTEPLGQTMLVPTHEVPIYEALVDEVNRQYRPDTFSEKLSVQSIVNYHWRIRRLSQVEAGLYALGRRDELADAEILVKYAKEFKNLAQQNRSLNRLLKTEIAHLKTLGKMNPRRRGLFLVPKGKRST
jgi:hypothetical protein